VALARSDRAADYRGGAALTAYADRCGRFYGCSLLKGSLFAVSDGMQYSDSQYSTEFYQKISHKYAR